MEKVAAIFAGMAIMGAVLVGAVNAQVDQLPAIEPIYSAQITTDANGWKEVVFSYPSIAEAPPPDFGLGTIEAYEADPSRSIAATVEAIAQAQKVLDAQGATLNLFKQIEAFVVSARVQEATHYLTERAAERGITWENDPKYFQSLNVLRQYQGLEELVQP